MRLLKKHFYIVAVLAIIAIGIFLRSYHFSDWIHFELDQARDANVISKAVDNGPGDLPLLGPRARGTFLRLGPVFYYFEYASAKIFGNNPAGMAASVLIFSFFSLPLFYFFCRRYFSKKNSIGLLLIFSLSIFLIVYSRFGWNPNPLPFFLLLFFYALLRAVDYDEKRKGWWLVLSALALVIATQLHFLAFVALPVCVLIFLVYKRPKISWRFWTMALSVIILFYVPMIINEMKTGGANFQQFVETVSGKSQKQKEEGTIIRKAIVNYNQHISSYFLILSGLDNTKPLANPASLNFIESAGKNFLLANILSVLLFIGGIILLLMQMLKEKENNRRDFLILSAIWLILIFGMFTLLANELSPRYFLLAIPLPFVFLGIILDFFEKRVQWGGKWIAIVIILFFAASNTLMVKKRFEEWSQSSFKPLSLGADRILKERTRVTLAQEQMILRYMLDVSKENGQPIYYQGDAQYYPAFKYLLKRSGALFDEINFRNIYRQGNFFFITITDPLEQWDIGKFREKYDIVSMKQFGTLTVININPKEEFINFIAKDFNQPVKKANSSAPKRYNWSDVFNGGKGEEDDEN